MEVTLIQIVEWTFLTIGIATASLNIIAPITKTNWDNKVLQILKKFLEIVSLNVKEDGTTKIEVILKR